MNDRGNAALRRRFRKPLNASAGRIFGKNLHNDANIIYMLTYKERLWYRKPWHLHEKFL